MNKVKVLSLMLAGCLILLGAVYLVAQSGNVKAAVNPNGPHLSGYAWSSNIGWIKFWDNQNTSPQFGVNVDAAGNLTGYAWSSNIGWIKFDPSLTGPVGNVTTGAKFDNATSPTKLTGWARACSVAASNCDFSSLKNDSSLGGWDGWISFNDTAGSKYGVNLSGNQFSGFAWGALVIGWVKMDGVTYVGNTSQINVSCSGTAGTSNITWTAIVTDGTGPYTYTWSSGTSNTNTNISALTQTSMSLTVRDSAGAHVDVVPCTPPTPTSTGTPTNSPTPTPAGGATLSFDINGGYAYSSSVSTENNNKLKIDSPSGYPAMTIPLTAVVSVLRNGVPDTTGSGVHLSANWGSGASSIQGKHNTFCPNGLLPTLMVKPKNSSSFVDASNVAVHDGDYIGIMFTDRCRVNTASNGLQVGWSAYGGGGPTYTIPVTATDAASGSTLAPATANIFLYYNDSVPKPY